MNEVNLTDRATISHIDPGTRIPGGAYTPSTEVIDATDVPCRLSAFSLRFPIERELAAQFGAAIKWICLFEAGYSVPNNRRLTISGTTKGVAWTRKLEVIGEIIKDTEMYHHVACNNLAEAKQ